MPSNFRYNGGPSYGPTQFVVTPTARVVTGQVLPMDSPRLSSTSTGELVAFADMKGYSIFPLRHQAYIASQYAAAGSNRESMAPGYGGSNTTISAYASTLDIGVIQFNPVGVEVESLNTSVSPIRLSHYVVRQRRYCSSGSSPLTVANALYGLHQTSNATNATVPMQNHVVTVLQPHVSFAKAPGWHRYFEVVAMQSRQLSHGQSWQCRLHLPRGACTPWMSTYDSNPVAWYAGGPTINVIDGVTCYLISEIHGLPGVNAAAGATSGTYTYNSQWVPGTASVTYRYTESYMVKPSTRMISTLWTAPVAYPGVQVPVNPEGETNMIMNEYGPAEAITAQDVI